MSICTNCLYPLYEHAIGIEEEHRCLADAASCVEGINCPDYIGSCDCVCNLNKEGE